MRDSFRIWEQQFGRRHPDWNDITAPDELLYLLDWFHQLSNGRPVTMGALLPIPATETLAWSQINRMPLRMWELEVIRLLDGTFLRVMAEKD